LNLALLLTFQKLIFHNLVLKISQIFIAVQCSFILSAAFLHSPYRQLNGCVLKQLAQFITTETARIVLDVGRMTVLLEIALFSKGHKILHNSHCSS
jgi:hypothetical protein